MALQLGVCLASQITDIDYAVLAEELGFDDLWFADSQMIWSDVYATMALAAARTRRIRIGTGVAVAGTRSAPVTAAAHATINAIAPGASDNLITSGLRNSLNAPALATVTGILTDPQFRVVIKALEQRQGVEVLVAPKVTTISAPARMPR